MKTSCIQGQLLPSARAEAERRVEAATEVTDHLSCPRSCLFLGPGPAPALPGSLCSKGKQSTDMKGS